MANEEMMIGLMPNGLNAEERCAYEVGWEKCEEYLSKKLMPVEWSDTHELIAAKLMRDYPKHRQSTYKDTAAAIYNIVITHAEPVTDDALLTAIKSAQEEIQYCRDELKGIMSHEIGFGGCITYEQLQTLITHAIKGESK